MKLGRSLAVVAGMILLVATLSWRASAAEDETRPAEFKVLERWIGEWDMEVSVKPNEFLPQGSRSTFKATIGWAVNNRFLRCDAQGQGTQGERKFKDAFTWICTFDPRAKNYVSTVFWANVGGGGDDWGTSPRGTGQWDEKAQTFTTRSVDPDSGIVSSGVTTWHDPDTHSFVNKVIDANGKVIFEMSGKCKRQK
jgi:hypothetical protein